jgi:hypothetical protein
MDNGEMGGNKKQEKFRKQETRYPRSRHGQGTGKARAGFGSRYKSLPPKALTISNAST